MPAMKDVGGETVKPASCFELSLPLSFFLDALASLDFTLVRKAVGAVSNLK